MEKWKRSLFFWLLVAAFFITAPAVILRARGYRFDFDRGVFVYSGSITIKSNPQNINVLLNGELNESKKLDRINNSSQISGLLPGEYDIKVTYPGFRTWDKKIPVRSGLSTEFWNVLLVRENYEKTPYAIKDLDRFFISPKNDLLATAKNTSDEQLNLNILDLKDDVIVHSFSLPNLNLVDQEAKENIEWSPVKNLYLSIPVIEKSSNKKAEDNNKDYIIVNLDSEETFSLEDFLTNNSVEQVRWHPQKENYLFFLSQNSLYRVNVTDSNDIVSIAQDVATYNLAGSYIYFSQLSNKIIYRKSIDKFDQEEQITNTFPADFQENINKIIIYDKDRIAILDKSNSLFIFNHGARNDYFKKLDSAVEGLHFSDDGKKLLFWTKNEISVYFLRDWDVQPPRQENEQLNLTRYINPIENVQWFSDYEHVLFNSGPYVKIIELDSRDKRNSMDILTLDSTNYLFTLDASLEKLFFVDKEKELYSIDFPEPTTFLGL